MTFSVSMTRRCFSGALLALVALFVSVSAAQAENLKLEARLIWGTNDSKSTNDKHKPVDEATNKKLGKIFKWKHYFVETTHKVSVKSRTSRKLKMSKDCTIEIKELPNAPIEVKLIGKGKVINKTRKPLKKGELFIIGGDDKNQCAWFVVIEKK